MDVWCQDVEKFHTAECILHGSVYFSVYQNVSLIDYWYLHFLTPQMQYTVQECSTHYNTRKTCQSSQWHRMCIFSLFPSTPIPLGIKTGII